MKTKAAIQTAHSQPLVIDDVEISAPGPDQVMLRLSSSGICHSDLHLMRDPSLRRPLVLGHEAAGVVTHVGDNVRHLSEGDHALVTWVKAIADSGVPKPVPSGLTRRGETVQRLIVCSWSEHVLADAAYVVAMPKEYPTDVTSIVGCAVLTGAGAVLNTAGVHPVPADISGKPGRRLSPQGPVDVSSVVSRWQVPTRQARHATLQSRADQ